MLSASESHWVNHDPAVKRRFENDIMLFIIYVNMGNKLERGDKEHTQAGYKTYHELDRTKNESMLTNNEN